MATIKFTGMDEYIRKLENLTAHSRGICKMAVWEGGKVVGDAIKAALEDIPVQDEYVQKGEMRTGIRSEEKEAIIAAFGLSKMRTGSSVSTKAGFKAGTKIRAVESGTSYMQKHPVVRQAVNKSKTRAENVMKAKFEEATMKIMLGV